MMKDVLLPDTKSIVIDAEAVAYDRETNKILPFQVCGTHHSGTHSFSTIAHTQTNTRTHLHVTHTQTKTQVLSTRARKDVKVEDIKVQVCLYAFDCLYLNGQPLLKEPLTKRREALYGAMREVPGRMCFASYKVCVGWVGGWVRRCVHSR